MRRIASPAGTRPIEDVLASVVVLLVALPLCMGIAVASGMPPTAGLVSGIIGGLVVGLLAGAPLQVSGPAAGLTVLVFQIVQDHGVAAIGPIVLLAGLIQLAAGAFRTGRYFQAVPPAVIAGMLAGIGALILLSQSLLMLGVSPAGSGLANLLRVPAALAQLAASPAARESALVGGAVIAAMALWPRLARRVPRLLFVPTALVGVVLGTGLVHVLGFGIPTVQLPENLLGAVSFTDGEALKLLLQPSIVGAALALAAIASAETLLCASAVDRMHDGPRARFDRELIAQGAGNALCGMLGALPVTGVIVRSSANIEAGAKTRLSAILHGAWLLLFVAFLPFVLRLVPMAALAGLLIFTGFKLLCQDVRSLAKAGRFQIVLFLCTFGGIVATDLLKGVVFGLVLAAAGLLWSFAHLQIRREEHGERIDLHLVGAATFLQLPELIAALDKVPAGREVHVHLDRLDYVDHAGLEALSSWEKQYLRRGGRLSLDWQSLNHRIQPPRRRARAELGAARQRRMTEGQAADA